MEGKKVISRSRDIRANPLSPMEAEVLVNNIEEDLPKCPLCGSTVGFGVDESNTFLICDACNDLWEWKVITTRRV